MGMSIGTYILQQRMARAREMIKTGKYSMNESNLIGYRNFHIKLPVRVKSHFFPVIALYRYSPAKGFFPYIDEISIYTVLVT